MIQRGQDSALILGQLALAENVTLLGESHPTQGAIFNRLGDFAYRKGDYEEAQESWLTALEINDTYADVTSLSTEASLFRLGVYTLATDSSHRSAPQMARALAFTRKVESSLDSSYSRLVYKLANVYEQLYHLDDFYRLLKKVINNWEINPDSDPQYAIRALVYLAEGTSKPLVSNVGKDVYSQDSAIVFGTQALAIAERHLDADDTLLAYTAIRLGDYHSRNGNYRRARQLWEKAWKINVAKLPDEHIEVQGSIYRMAGVYRAIGEYAKSEALYKKAVELRAKTQGAGHPETAGMYMSLGRLYHTTADYDEASKCYLKALSIREKAVERVESDIAQSLRFLGLLDYDRGDYASAERYMKRALSIRQETLGEGHALTANCVGDLGELYMNWGKLQEAEDAFTSAIEVRKTFLGEKHPNVAISLERLATFYIIIGDHAKAQSSLELALSLLEAESEMNRLRYASVLLNLAHVSLAEDDIGKAKNYAKLGLQVSKLVFGEGDHRLIPAITQMARVEMSLNRPAVAEEFLVRALNIAHEFDGLFQPKLAEVYDTFADLLLRQRKQSEALRHVKLSFEIRMSVFENGASVMSEHDAFQFERQVYKTRDRYLSQYFQCNLDLRPPVTDLLSVILASKGVASTTFYDRYRTLRSKRDPTITLTLDSLRLARAHISRLYVDGPKKESPVEYQGFLNDAISKAERLEEALAQLSGGYSDSRKKLRPNITDLIAALPENALLVEYFNYERQGDNKGSTSKYFGALTVSDKGEVFAHDLGDAALIDSVVALYREHIQKVSHSSLLPTSDDMAEYIAISRTLTDIVWSPLKATHSVSGPIYIAPDGSLNLVSFAGLIGRDQQFLIEGNAIQYVLSGNDMLREPANTRAGSGIAIFGDPDFDASPEQRVESNARIAAIEPGQATDEEKRNLRSACDVLARKKMPRLTGSLDELDNIASIWRETSEEEVWKYQGSLASEDAFKKESIGKRVVHVATHGFFAAGDCNNHQAGRTEELSDNIFGENPLLLSGLYFAGANLYGAGADQLGLDDGVLTAVEVSGMNLDGVEWVVLSACESGIGDNRAGEGVHGLRYAFRVAGAESIISVLWKISDYDAADFMRRLYGGKSGDLAVRMREAALARLDDLRMRGQPEHPAIWAAFVASGFKRR